MLHQPLTLTRLVTIVWHVMADLAHDLMPHPRP